MVDFTDNQKKLWNEWGVINLVIFSLFLQIFLTFSAPFRRRKKGKWVFPFIWAAYLLADWVATFALGSLSNSIHGNPECNDSSGTNKHVASWHFFTECNVSHSTNSSSTNEHFVFWAPFPKYNVSRCTNGSSTDENVVFWAPFSKWNVNHCTNSSTNEHVAFWAPFLLLHLGGPDTITALALEDNQLWLRHFLSLPIYLIAAFYVLVLTLPKNRLLIPTLIIFMVGIVRYIERSMALFLASTYGFRYLIGRDKEPHQSSGGAVRPMPDRRRIDRTEAVQSAHRFLAIYKCLAIDHHLFFYVREKSRSYFQSLHPKDAFRIIEIELGLLFDMIYTKATVIHSRMGLISRIICSSSITTAYVIFLIKSLGHLNTYPVNMDSCVITHFLFICVFLLDMFAFASLIVSNWRVSSLRHPMARRFASLVQARQPAYMYQYNLISYCLRRYWTWNKMAKLPWIGEFTDQLRYTHDMPVSAKLKDFIFSNLLIKSRRTTSLDDFKHMSEHRWDWVIDENGTNPIPSRFFNLELEDSILLWHIATDICYHSRNCNSVDRDFSKVVSDYMHYLLVMHPTMISSTEGTGQIKWQSVRQQVTSFINDTKAKNEMDFCGMLCDTANMEILMGIGSFLLVDACTLAQELLRQQPSIAWKSISEVWVELLSSAANHCSGRYHAQRLVKGGEFLTSIWLLMAHLGLAKQYKDGTESDVVDITEFESRHLFYCM
ncbi:uncharacterized protein LOC131257815 [Magnolia sinica]|uniref:uncharacterized protein LOC131257815 n=1 Tax=Magnolia sinica TaxID=86752 RepID=UPI00265887B6|nr:uncharacterized protein LOC131257815 [Magnolia sinica]XP_058114711.1 uncharacterized protein LOC131257815 [Magnolia sinica]